MIPLRVQLRNFMCYRDPRPLDLSGVRLACLAGDNGHGKSALLDSMTWALWSKARAHQEDELVTTGQTDMKVQFDFQLGDVVYRVTRGRQVGSTSRGSLELEIADGTAFRSLTASTQRATQARINEILRIDYDTFINSALLLQGRADEFTTKAPAERKRILGEILGLSVYDELEQKSKERALEAQQAERQLQARIQEIDKELAVLANHAEELRLAEEQLADLSERTCAATQHISRLREHVQHLHSQKLQLQQVVQRLQLIESELQQMDQQAAEQGRRLAAYQAILAQRESIDRGYAELLQAREVESRCNTTLRAYVQLEEAKSRIEKAIADAGKDLEVQQSLASRTVEELQAKSGEKGRLTSELGLVRAEIQTLLQEQRQLQQCSQELKSLAAEAATIKAQNVELELRVTDALEKQSLLQTSTPSCPLCGQALAETQRADLLEQMNRQLQELQSLHHANEISLSALGVRIADRESRQADLEHQLEQLTSLKAREASLAGAIQDSEQASISLVSRRAEIDEIRRRLRDHDYAHNEHQELHALKREQTALGYDPAAHDEARQTVTRYAQFEADKTRLESANQAVAELLLGQQQLAQLRKEREDELGRNRQEREKLQLTFQEYDESEQQLVAQETVLRDLQDRASLANLALGAAQQKRAQSDQLQREREGKRKRHAEQAEDRTLFESLRVAFGKKGIQALIIENVLPELEHEANALLARLTEGQMLLRFDTQHDTKRGETVETLDIKISDEGGSRSYETYSGGEAFRIDFAIRIALSKLLTRRSGAQLQTLMIDEGFGSQDAEGRLRLIEAINSIRDDFALIVVITHIEELKDAFPVRIDVFKTPEGSNITIA